MSGDEKDINGLEVAEQAAETVDMDLVPPGVVRRVKLKLDFIVLPTLTTMYIFNSLDRSNLGNAKTAGLPKDTNLKGDQYNLILTFYYVAFVLFGPVMPVLTKVFSGKLSLPCMMLAFGIASASTAAAHNFTHLLVCRIFVGIFESGFLASVVFYLSIFYTRLEIATRIGLFYAGAVFASAFGGLLAYGVFHIRHAALPSWAYLFILEGCLTCILAIIAFCVLPKAPGTAWFLSAEERCIADIRLQTEEFKTGTEEFHWGKALGEFRTIHGYARALIAVCFGIQAQSSANFLAILTAQLGYSVVKTNLYTVAPALSAAVIVVLLARSSDYFRERGFHMAAPMLLGTIGYAILIAVDATKHRGIGYMAIFFCTIGAYPMSVIFSAWTVGNIRDLSARAFTTGVLFTIGSSTGLISSNVFQERQAPRYIVALAVNASLAGAGVVFILMYSLYLRALNRKADREEATTVHVDERHEHWRDSGPRTSFRFQA